MTRPPGVRDHFRPVHRIWFALLRPLSGPFSRLFPELQLFRRCRGSASNSDRRPIAPRMKSSLLGVTLSTPPELALPTSAFILPHSLVRSLSSHSKCPICLIPHSIGAVHCSVAQSCPTLCDPINSSTPGLPVHHHLPELAQAHVH